MKRLQRKFICMALALLVNIMVISPVLAMNATDIKGHWAEKQIEAWMQKGLISGYNDGTVRPDKQITRAEFAAMINRTFAFTKTSETGFKDVKSKNWYAADISKAKAAGYIAGMADGTVRPLNIVSRQEAAVMLGRVLKLKEEVSGAAGFSDASSIASWSKGYVGAIAKLGYLTGIKGGNFRPIAGTTRAEAITMLSLAAGELYNKAGTYGNDKNATAIKGNLTISKPGVTVKNTVISGNLYLTEGIGNGAVTLENVVVKGTTTVSGGGEHSIILLNSELGKVVIQVPDNSKLRIVAQGSTSVSEVETRSIARLEEENVTGEGFQDIVVQVPRGFAVELAGDFESVDVEVPGAKVILLSGTIGKMKIANKSTDANINISAGAAVKELVVDAGNASITGKGKIENAQINASNIKLEQKPDSVKVAEGVSNVTVANEGVTSQNNPVQTPTATTPPAGSGSNGGNGGSGGNGDNSGSVVPGKVLAPTASVASGEVVSGTKVSLSTATSGADIYYTLDGTVPTTASTKYAGSIEITKALTIKAIAVKSGMTKSEVSSFSYTIGAVVPTKVKAPTASAASGEVVSGTKVSLSTATSGADIFYTLDGKTPTTASTKYTGSIEITKALTIKAIAVKSGMTDSQVSSFSYTIKAVVPTKVEAPTASVAAGEVASGTKVSLSTATTGADIYYTLNGTVPTTESTKYAGSIEITKAMTIKAIAVKSGMADSEVSSFSYTIKAVVPGKVSAPTASVAAGEVASGTKVSLSTATSGADIFYTLDGKTPTTASTKYTGSIEITKAMTIKAIAVKSGMTDSQVSSFSYTIGAVVPGKVAAPTASVAAGEVVSGTTVSLSTATDGADIYYTLDGTVPTTASTKYASTTTTGSIVITEAMTIKAIAVKSGMTDSEVSSFSYTIEAEVPGKLAAPTASVKPGVVLDGTMLELYTATSGAVIWYSVNYNGYDKYMDPINLSELNSGKPVTITASVLYGKDKSDTSEFVYTFKTKMPKASITPGAIRLNDSVGLLEQTPGSTIYYTMDGSEPTTGSTKYSVGILMKSSATIKAIAVSGSMEPSDVATFEYTLVPTGVTVNVKKELSDKGYTEGILLETSFGDVINNGYIKFTFDDGINKKSVAVEIDKEKVAEDTPDKPKLMQQIMTALGSLLDHTGYEAMFVDATNTTIEINTEGSNGYIPGNVSITVDDMNVTGLNPDKPTASVTPGPVSGGTKVSLDTPLEGATILYTLDGTNPAIYGQKYNYNPFYIEAETTIKAVVIYINGIYGSSDVSTFSYTMMERVKAPTASPEGGAFESGKCCVYLATETPGASIYYTTDGSQPYKYTSTLYKSSGINLSSDTTIKAIAIKVGMVDSYTSTFSYVVKSKLAAPTTNLGPGAVISRDGSYMRLKSADASARIFYTKNGDTPTINGDTPAIGTSEFTSSSPDIYLTEAITIKAIAVREGYFDSDVSTFEYTMRPIAEDPTALPGSGTIMMGTKVTLQSKSPGVSIFYTTDGNENLDYLINADGYAYNSTKRYTGEIIVPENMTIYAVADSPKYDESSKVRFDYKVKLNKPELTEKAGVLPYGTYVDFMDKNEGTGDKIYYTTDGSTPTTSSKLYEGYLMYITESVTIQAIAVKDNIIPSDVSTYSYTILEKAAVPTASIESGTTVDAGQKVELMTSTTGASVYYVIDSTPDDATDNIDVLNYKKDNVNIHLYSEPIIINQYIKIRAIVVHPNMRTSDIITFKYLVN